MLIHTFIYSFKILLRNKSLIFWTFAFPIILGTFFNMAFSNIENSEKLSIIPIAIVENDDFTKNDTWKEAFDELSDENNEDRLFDTQYVTEERAEELLAEDEIAGYMILEGDTPRVVVTTSGIDETIFKYATEEISQTTQIVEDTMENKVKEEMMAGNFNPDYEKIAKDIIEEVQNQEVSIKNITSKNLSYTMIEFYTLIAMTCLYGGILGMTAINQNLANMSSKGKRVAVSPVSKGKMVFSSMLASYITALLGLAILFVYTVFVLKVDYGDQLPLIIELGMVGSLAGLCMGIALGSSLKTNENTKTGIMIAVTMLGCFLSGMMGITMKYIVDTNVPWLNKINPANMITDGFYSLYYYDTLDRYYFNIISLLVFSGIMFLVAYWHLRRQKYDSI